MEATTIRDHLAAGMDRIEIRCAACGYGGVVSHIPDRCPMCGGLTWRERARRSAA